MDLVTTLDELGISSILDPVQYKTLKITNYEKLKETLDKIFSDNLKVLVVGDPDPDGLMCVKQWVEFFYTCGYMNYDIFPYEDRSHKLNNNAVNMAIENKYDYIIINDTASKELEKINKLIDNGVNVVIIDHHQTPYEYDFYPENCLIFNSVIENRINNSVPNLTLSAGALVFLLLDAYLTDVGKSSDDLVCYALISLYADCIDMSSSLNRSIYYKAMSVAKYGLPNSISLFLNERTVFCRRAIEFQYTPRLNCAFRCEVFILINNYAKIKKGDSIKNMLIAVEKLKELHSKKLKDIEEITDIMDVEELDNIVVGNLQSVSGSYDIEGDRLYNYTGLIANQLADKYKKSSVVYCNYKGKVKGSFRDIYARNYLEIFQKVCKADGHNSAFGIEVPLKSFMDFYDKVRYIGSLDIKQSPNRPIVFKYDEYIPESLEVQNMALFNEFSGNSLPLVLISKEYKGGLNYKNNRRYSKMFKFNNYRYDWGDYMILSKTRIDVGDKFMLRPTLSQSIRLINI